jgi:quinoprotein glucose dehydrogenase
MNSYMLVALDAKTGLQVTGFGKNGVIDMAENFRWNERPGLREGRVANTSPPAIVGNVLVASISMHTGSTPNLPGASINEKWPMNIPGDVVAYDTKTGKMLWRFNTIPRQGEEGAETWLTADPKVWDVPGGLNDWAKQRPELRQRPSNQYTGNAGFWAPVTADPELGLFYIGVESATSDYYGGYRPGNNLYANSVLALDAKTGKKAWHFQLTHHDLWDYDPPTAPRRTVTSQGVKRPCKFQVLSLTFIRRIGVSGELLCRRLSSRWLTEWFHANALIIHFQNRQVFCAGRRLENHAVARYGLHQRACEG